MISPGSGKFGNPDDRFFKTLAQRQAAGGLSTAAELEETIPKRRLTDWFAERLHRLPDVVSAE
jgi:hypothetical protein